MKKINIMLFLLTMILIGGFLVSQKQLVHISSQNTRIMSDIHKKSIPGDFVPQPMKITAIGDSLTEGVGDSSNKGGYLYFLKQKLQKLKGISEVVIQNYGNEGNQTYDLIYLLRNPLVQQDIKESDFVFITIGGNDLMTVVENHFFELSLDVFLEALPKLQDQLKETLDYVKEINPNAVIVLIGIYNPFIHWFPELEEVKKITNDWNLLAKSVLDSYENGYFIDIEDIFEEGKVELLSDKDYFHPNNKGYELIAERVFTTLIEQVEPSLTNRLVAKDED